MRLSFFLAALCIVPFLASAQEKDSLFRFDQKIDYFEAKGQRDSLLFYINKKALSARWANNFALWAWVRLQASDFLYDSGDDAASSAYLDKIQQERWRPPRNKGESEPICYLQSNRGQYLFQSGQLLQAIAAYEEAAGYYEIHRFEEFSVVDNVYKPLGNCFTMLGDNDKALAVFQKALQEGADNETLAGLYCNIGLAWWNKGDFRAATDYYRQGLALKGISSLKRALLLGALAQNQIDCHEEKQALKNAFASLDLLAGVPLDKQVIEYRCYSRRAAGIANMLLGHYADAKHYLNLARSDAGEVFGQHSRDLGKIEIELAKLLLQTGDEQAAIITANRALTAVLPQFYPTDPSRNPLPTTFYEENVIFEALTVKALAAESLGKKTADLAWLRLSLECHELAWQAENTLRKVYQYSTSKLSLQVSARIREEAAMRVARLLYEKKPSELILEKAFNIAERSKAALLSDNIHDNLLRQRLAGSDPRFEELTQLRQSLSFFEKQMLLDPGNSNAGKWRQDADELVSRIKMKETALASDYPALNMYAAQGAADLVKAPHTPNTIIEYFCGTGQIEAFMISNGKLAEWRSFPNNSLFQSSVASFLKSFEDPNAQLNNPAGFLLDAWNLGKYLLPETLPESENLIIVPDGLLNFIPFEALLSSQPAPGASLKNAPYLIRKKQVQYAWSLSVLNQQMALKSGASEFALALAPGFRDGARGLAPLESSKTERPRPCFVLENDQADWQHFMAIAHNYHVIHFSTHAFASTNNGVLPHLELYDQALFLPDIYALPLSADLVTLSACQTGLGKEEAGEGVMSLARAFAQAGAACVVSSLWSVNDKSTNLVLSGFYDNIESGQSISEALRNAKLAYLNDSKISATLQAPYFWAGLTMVGDDRVVVEKNRWWWLLLLIPAILVIGYFFRPGKLRRLFRP